MTLRIGGGSSGPSDLWDALKAELRKLDVARKMELGDVVDADEPWKRLPRWMRELVTKIWDRLGIDDDAEA